MLKEQEFTNLSIPDEKFDKPKAVRVVENDYLDLQSDRQEWIQKRKQWLRHWDDFVTKHTKPAFKGGSQFHIPLTFSQMKAIKAKLIRGIFQLNPFFFVRPTEQTDASQIETITTLMDYTLKRYINYHKGIFPEVSNWIHDLIVEGFGIAKVRWDRKIRSYIDVVEIPTVEQVTVPLQDGTTRQIPIKKMVTEEVSKEEVVFDGPVFETISPDDFLMPKVGVDLDDADKLIHRIWLSTSELRTHAKSGFFDAKVVKQVLEQDKDGDKRRGDGSSRELEAMKDMLEGVKSIDAAANNPKHEVLEWYGKYDINEDGIDEEVVFWVHRATSQLLRWTYLDRISKTGKRPFFKVDFLPKPRNLYSMGLVEMMYPLNVELDAMHNMRTDAGKFLIPFGVYRAASGLKPDELKIQPGTLIPVDDVDRDLRFVEMPKSAVIFGQKEEEALLRHAERLVALSDLQFGRVSEVQSTSRTAFGVARITEESNIQIDLLLRHVYQAWSQVLKAIFQLLQTNLPVGFAFRVTGDLGDNIFNKIRSRDEITGNYDFEVTSNTAQLNKEVSRQNLLQAFQLGMNPILLQLGITTPRNIFNMLAELYKSYDILEISKYATKPEEASPPLDPLDAIRMMSQGMTPPVGLQDNHELAIETAERYMEDPNFLAVAQSNPVILSLLKAYLQSHQQMQAIMEAQAQLQNVTGLQLSPNLASKVAAGNAGLADASRRTKRAPEPSGKAGRIPGEEPNFEPLKQ